MAACTAIVLHGHKVRGSVQVTIDVTVIGSASEFSALQVKHFVPVLTVNQVHTEPDVGGVRFMRREAQGQLVALSVSSVILSVLLVGTLDNTGAGALLLSGHKD